MMTKANLPFLAALQATQGAVVVDPRTETISSNSVMSVPMVDPHHNHRDTFRTKVLPAALQDIVSAGGRFAAIFEIIEVEERSQY